MYIIDWNVVSTSIAMIAILITIIGMWLENRRSRQITAIDLFLRTEEKFRHDKDMLETRKKASNALLNGRVTPEVYDILNYFELVGELLKKRVFDNEMAWNSFYFRAVGYWFATQKHLEEIRADDPTVYGSYEYLIEKLLKVEKKKTKRSISSILPSSSDIQEFLLEECRGFEYQLHTKLNTDIESDAFFGDASNRQNQHRIEQGEKLTHEGNQLIVILHQGVDQENNPMIANACRVRDNLSKSFDELGFSSTPVYLDNQFDWITSILSINPKMILNVADLGFFYNNALEPNIPALLDGIGIAYSGSECYCMYFSSDKFASKKYLNSLEIPTPKCWLFDHNIDYIEFPVILKHRRLHNSEGISLSSVVSTREELLAKRYDMEINGYSDELIIEEYIDGIEICVGFMGNGENRRVLPFVEFNFGKYFEGKPKIRSFKAKWQKDTPEYSQVSVQLSSLPVDVTERISDFTLRIASIFEIKDYGRVDYRLKGEPNGLMPYVIDINANPDLNDDATLFIMANYAGMNYTEFIKSITETTLERYAI